MKKGPLILLGILIVTLFFILGMQFGKRVKTADEALQLLLTIAPTPSVFPTISSITNPVEQLTSSTCGISFLYPAGLEPRATSSDSGALINTKNDKIISFSCGLSTMHPSEETTSVKLSNVGGIEYTQGDIVVVEIKHPSRGLTLKLQFPTHYRSLIERTFEFIK